MRPALLCSTTLLFNAAAFAQPFSIEWYTIDAGGSQVLSGGNFTVSATVGQHDAAGPISGGSFEIGAGFWYGFGPGCVADWNGDGLVNTADFLAYLNDYNAVLAGGSFIFNDPDLAFPFGIINTADFLAFLNIYNAGCTK